MSHDDFAFEPIRGLPAMLPADEKLLWQGSPDWKTLAIRAYHVRKIAIYFLGIIAWRIAIGIRNGHQNSTIVVSCAFLLLLGGIAVAMLCVLAYFNARSTVYSITSRRVLFRHGIAVPMTMNIPFKLIERADLRNFADGTGEIWLTVPADQRVGYMITWPHLRPGRYARPVPSFRALWAAERVANVLGGALAAETGASAQRITGQEAVSPSFGPQPATA
jgi:hypothetical protein